MTGHDSHQIQDRAERPTEDDLQRDRLGPRGVPGQPSPSRMTPQRDKKTPETADPPHTA